MTSQLLKWAIPAGVFAALGAASFARETFHAERVIAAPPEAVWAVLTSAAEYPDWNPVFVSVEGTFGPDQKTKTSVKVPNGRNFAFKSRITAFEPGKELRQSGGFPGILTFEHQWILDPVDGGTRVIQQEVDRGLALWFINLDWVDAAYSAAIKGLEKQVLATSD